MGFPVQLGNGEASSLLSEASGDSCDAFLFVKVNGQNPGGQNPGGQDPGENGVLGQNPRVDFQGGGQNPREIKSC